MRISTFICASMRRDLGGNLSSCNGIVGHHGGHCKSTLHGVCKCPSKADLRPERLYGAGFRIGAYPRIKHGCFLENHVRFIVRA